MPQHAVHGLGAQKGLGGRGEMRGVEEEGPGLRSPQAAVEGDQLLERAALLDHRVVEAVDHNVGDVGEAVDPAEVPRRAVREQGERVRTCDLPIREPAAAGRAEGNRPVL